MRAAGLADTLASEAVAVSNETAQLAPAPRPRRWRLVRWLLGLVLLIASLAAAGMLVYQHLTGIAVPGCAPGSGCAELASSRWGNVLGWPTSFLGTAYFAALIIAWLWIGLGQGVSRWFKWGVRLGVLGSVLLIIVVFVEGHLCQYCTVVHAGNLAFWLVVECAQREPRAPLFRPALVGALLFAAVSGGLWLMRGEVEEAVAERDELLLEESIQEILQTVRAQAKLAPEADEVGEPFTGRYRAGPERAAIRIVVFSDYQCKDCKKTEDEIEAALEARDDVSYCHMHYPLSHECNRQIKFKHYHDHACRAARAAEAAGIVGGGDAFWAMHRWLFEHEAEFSDEQLRAALAELGIGDADRFLDLMEGPETLRRVEADVEKAIGLGITGTPMVFINGVELRGTDLEGAVPRAVAAVARENPKPLPATVDRPQGSLDRLFSQWRDGEPIELPEQPSRWTLGPEDAKLAVLLVIDYQNPYSPGTSRTLREVVARRDDVRLDLWHFPVSRQFNPKYAKMKEERHPHSWQMTLAAVAAGHLGGPNAFWKMHDWLLDHQVELFDGDDFPAKEVAAAALSFGLDADEFARALQSEEVRKSLDAEVSVGIAAEFGFPPRIYVAGRNVQGLEPPPELLHRILDAAVGD